MRFLILLISIFTFEAVSSEALILPMRERAEVIDQIIDERIATVLPGIMRRTGIDTVSYTHLTLPTKRIV